MWSCRVLRAKGGALGRATRAQHERHSGGAQPIECRSCGVKRELSYSVVIYFVFFRGSSAAFTYVIANGPSARMLSTVGTGAIAKWFIFAPIVPVSPGAIFMVLL